MAEYHLVVCRCGAVAEMEQVSLDRLEYRPPARGWYERSQYCSAQCYGLSLVEAGEALIAGKAPPQVRTTDGPRDWFGLQQVLGRFMSGKAQEHE